MTHHVSLADLTLGNGGHSSRALGMCLLEATAWWAGEPHSDHPACVSPIIATFGRALNDALPDDLRQQLVPIIPMLVGTVGSAEVEQRRALLMADHAVRRFASAASAAASAAAWSASSTRSVQEVMAMVLELFGVLVAVGAETGGPV